MINFFFIARFRHYRGMFFSHLSGINFDSSGVAFLHSEGWRVSQGIVLPYLDDSSLESGYGLWAIRLSPSTIHTIQNDPAGSDSEVEAVQSTSFSHIYRVQRIFHDTRIQNRR